MRTTTSFLFAALSLGCGSAALVLLGCAPARITDDAGGGTGTTDTDDGGGSSSSGGNPGASSSGGSTGTGSAGGDDSSASGSDDDTGSTEPPCGAIQLADVALGIGGFALDGESEGWASGRSVSAAGDVDGDGLADFIVGAPRADANGV
jgi:hypothetical protein